MRARFAVAMIAVVCTTIPSGGPRPDAPIRILVDEGHHNLHRADGTLAPFLRILANSGYEVIPLRGRVTPEVLAECDLFVSGNPFPVPREDLVRSSLEAGEPFRFHSAASRPAFDEMEAAALATWVARGGAVLLLADHAPHGETMRPLAEAFGVELRNVVTSDPEHPAGDRPGWILFTRSAGLIGEHPITRNVDSVATSVGQSIRGSIGSSSLLTLATSAVDTRWDPSTKDYVQQSAAGRSQAVALEFGEGRVVVTGEAGFLVATLDSVSAAPIFPGPGNLAFGLNVVHWLASPRSARRDAR